MDQNRHDPPDGEAARSPSVSFSDRLLDFVQLRGIAHRINKAFEQRARNFYHVGLLG
jgi:hypothetical protein